MQKVLQNRHYYAKSVQARLLGQKPLLETTTRKIKSENGKDRELEIAPFIQTKSPTTQWQTSSSQYC